ncbi:SDR family oxidoreductase [Candidatus Pelagibacter sp.]|nr:SDR family oxidoreductase [Candidatus Pelagibacter sp.]
MNKILILGSTGLLGSTLLKYFSKKKNFQCFGAIRKDLDIDKLKNIKNIKLYKINYNNKKNILKIFNEIKPDLIINCIGVVKQITHKKKLSEIVKVNSFFPHYLAELISLQKKIRLIHFSTDCVFLGQKGNYKEDDLPDAHDIYGRSKLLGELSYRNTLTLRTSIIGHELETNYSLLNWFLSQKKSIEGYKNAFFSGLSALEVANFLDKFIIPNKKIEGIFHLSGKVISKYNLLNLIKVVYKKDIKININRKMKIDRSLNSNSLKRITGYKPKSWNKIIKEMFEFNNFK